MPVKAVKAASARRRPSIGLALGTLILSIGYIGYAGYAFSALRTYRQAETLIPGDAASVPDDQHLVILKGLQAAANAVPLQPDYAFRLGQYLARRSQRTGDFETAEYWLRRAIMRDPANPWYYYESGVLSYQRQDCHDWQATHTQEPWEICPVTRSFLAALRLAPKDVFLRRAVGQWYAWYDYPGAVNLMRGLIEDDRQGASGEAGALRSFSKLLYDLRMDYESDQQAALAAINKTSQKSSHVPPCQPEILPQTTASNQIELGHDDGSAEWYSPLTTDTLRIKKAICLPEDITMYRTATLRIFMTYAEQSMPPIRVMLDDLALPLEEWSFTQAAQWYELPVPLSALAGKRHVAIYIRAQSGMPGGTPVSIGGDQHTPRRDSVFNWETINDLSSEPGKQTGEYLIRLVLQ